MRVCFLGDSLVLGTGDPACLGWPGRLCAALRRAGRDVTLYNLGVRGDTSGDLRARFRAEVAHRLPSDVDGRLVLSFGTNDTTADAGGGPRIALDDSVANARAILAESAARWPVLVVGPPWLADPAQGPRLAALSIALGALCTERGVPFVPVLEALGRSRAWRDDLSAHDGMHPRSRGYAALARLVARSPAWRAWTDAAPVGARGLDAGPPVAPARARP